MLKIILADDDTLVREGLKLLIESHQSLEVIGEASNGTQVLEMIDQGLEPDIVISDINMPGMDGFSLIKSLKEKNEKIKIIMLSMLDEKKAIEQSFLSGASGYLLKSIHPEEFILAINQIGRGTRYLCSTLSINLLEESITRSSHQLPDMDLNVDFSPREMEVLTLIAEGLTNSEMSDRLYLSKRTIEGHRQTLIEKTGCRNTASLIKFAVLNGIIQ